MSETIWRPAETANPELELMTLANSPVELGRDGSAPFYFAADLLYSFYRDKDKDHRVHAEKYIYSVSDHPHQDDLIFQWHWHPESSPDPHVHVSGPHEKLHIPTGRVSFEKVIEFLITDCGVLPRHNDWSDVITEAHERHVEYRTWG